MLGETIPPSLLREISSAVIFTGLYIHRVDESSVSSSAGDTLSPSSTSFGQGGGAGGAFETSVHQGADDLSAGPANRALYSLVGLDSNGSAHPDLAKIARDKFEAIRPYIRDCVDPQGRPVYHFQHQLMLELVTAAIRIFLTKYPHLREAYSASERLSRLIFGLVVGVVSLFFIE